MVEKERRDRESALAKAEAKRLEKENRERMRVARFKALQEKIRNALKAEILSKIVIDSAEVRDPSLNYELLDVHYNYQPKNCLSSLGGHFQQLYLVVASIM